MADKALIDFVLVRLLRSRKFLLALFALFETALFYYVPGAPEDVWKAVTELIMLLVVAITVQDSAMHLAFRALPVRSQEENPYAPIIEPLMALLKDARFWFAVFGIVQTVVLRYAGVPPEIWQQINLLAEILIGMFTVEAGFRYFRQA